MNTMHARRRDLRVLIVEDHVLFAESLELALSVEGYDVRRMSVPDIATANASVLAAAMAHRPRIALLDLDLGTLGDGINLITPLAKAGVHVVVITGSSDRARWGDALRHGARTVLPKSGTLQDILSTVRRINTGQPVMDVRQREELMRYWHSQRATVADAHDRLHLLTPREREVLGMLMLGQTVHDIAAAGVVSEATVRTQVKSILGKLQVSSQIAAVGLAHQVGWKAPPTALPH